MLRSHDFPEKEVNEQSGQRAFVDQRFASHTWFDVLKMAQVRLSVADIGVGDGVFTLPVLLRTPLGKIQKSKLPEMASELLKVA